MDEQDALDGLAALSQSTRLAAFRLLVSHEPGGAAAGEIARDLNVPQNTMSAHLATLTRCGLAVSERQSRSIIYRANLERFRELIAFLLQDCCGGRPDVCQLLIAEITPCYPPARKRKVQSRV